MQRRASHTIPVKKGAAATPHKRAALERDAPAPDAWRRPQELPSRSVIGHSAPTPPTAEDLRRRERVAAELARRGTQGGRSHMHGHDGRPSGGGGRHDGAPSGGGGRHDSGPSGGSGHRDDGSTGGGRRDREPTGGGGRAHESERHGRGPGTPPDGRAHDRGTPPATRSNDEDIPAFAGLLNTPPPSICAIQLRAIITDSERHTDIILSDSALHAADAVPALSGSTQRILHVPSQFSASSASSAALSCGPARSRTRIATSCWALAGQPTGPGRKTNAYTSARPARQT